MKVLFVYKDYYPVLGGIEGHIKYLAEGMRARGVDAQVLVTNSGPRTITESINGVPVTKAGRLANVSSAPVSSELFRLMGGFRPDVAHLHFPYPIGEMAYLARGRARRMVVTYHSDIVRQKYLRIAYQPFLRALLRRADAISISNPAYLLRSPFVAPHAGKCVVIHHGQDLSRFEPSPPIEARAAQIRAEYGDQLVLFVGKLRYYKGVDQLIRAFIEIAPPASAVIVGSGPMEAEWRRLARGLGLGDRVRFAGSVSDDDLPAYYRASRVFVLPSTQPAETWGAVQIEAMASGVPCVCTELGTGTSYVNGHGDTGLVVPPADPHALAEAISQLLGDEPLRARMGAAAEARARAEFSQMAMVDRTLELYERLLAV